MRARFESVETVGKPIRRSIISSGVIVSLWLMSSTLPSRSPEQSLSPLQSHPPVLVPLQVLPSPLPAQRTIEPLVLQHATGLLARPVHEIAPLTDARNRDRTIV